MNDLIRTDVVFGKRVNIVGNISADLVLESLGKIYIKSRNKSQTLEEVITSLVTQDPNTSTSRTKVVEGIEGLDTSEFKEGTFVFDKLSNILYLFIDGELLELINVAPDGTGYVKRTGDTMTGRLAIYVKNGPPLYVNSADLVENLNALYLNGETAENFTRRNANEKIEGKWTFKSPTTFDSNTLFYRDIVTHGSVGTPNFSSGFGGYGWRMDADTNTLTVDNLIVRKLMLVYELVVNKISATNGSLWVTNAGKVTNVIKLSIKESDFFDTSNDEYNKFAAGLKLGYAFIKLGTKEIRQFNDNQAFMTASGTGVLVKSNCLTVESLKLAKLIIISANINMPGETFDDDNDKKYNIYPLFDPEFKFDCTFPIVPRESYIEYKNFIEQICNAQVIVDKLNAYGTLTLEQQDLRDQNLAFINSKSLDANPYNYIKYCLPYYKYFAGGDYYLVSFDSDELPVFKPGDLVRCQKWTYNGIKYYDAVVCSLIDTKYVILLADSVLDMKTTITYDSSLEPTVMLQKDELNTTLYNSSARKTNPTEDLLGIVEEKDGLVLMGHLWDPLRLNAVYITSTDNGAPFMDVMSGINRPDFSVIYYTPIFKTLKLHAKAKGSIIFNNNVKAIDVPTTANYYILSNNDCDYTYIKVVLRINNENVIDYYLLDGYYTSVTANDCTCTIEEYLSTYPTRNTLLINESDHFHILLEDGGNLLTEENAIFILEAYSNKLLVASTKTTKARFGNLDGIQDEMFPIDKLPYGYGLYGLNVFLTGEFYLSNGKAVADIGKDAISFALAGQEALNNSIELLRYDTNAAYDLMKLNVYSKGALKSAGMWIGTDETGNNPGIVMWGNLILIATTSDELYGFTLPTALFADGKIRAKFLEIHDAYSDVKYQYEAIENKYSKKRKSRDDNWVHIIYSAPSGYNVDIDNPATTGGVKIYTYDDNGETKIKYIRKFHIDMYQDNITDTLMKSGEYPSDGIADRDAWIEVGLDGDIPDITDIHYVTFNINGNLTDGTSQQDEAALNTVLKDVTLWSLRSDGSGNLGGKAIYWNDKGNIKIDSELISSKGSIGSFNYNRDDFYCDMLEAQGYYIEAKYPKFLLYNDKLKTTLQMVSYEPKEYINTRPTYALAGCSILDSEHLHIRKGYQDDCVDLSNLKGLFFEKESQASMGVSYPLVNLTLVPYKSNNEFYFYVSCNYVPQIKGINVYYRNHGVYYFIINCDGGFSSFLSRSLIEGKLNISVSGVNYMYGGLSNSVFYFGAEPLRSVANLAGINFGLLHMGDQSNSVQVGGNSDWWQLALTKTLADTSGITSVVGKNSGLSYVKADNMGGVQIKISSGVIAFKVEVINEDGYTEGGTILQLNYNTFLDSKIQEIQLLNAGNYETDLLLVWVKLPYMTLKDSFYERYQNIIGATASNSTDYESGSLGYYLYWINRVINNGGVEHRNILIDGNILLSDTYAHVYIPTKTHILDILGGMVDNIYNSTIRDVTLANSFIANYTDELTVYNINLVTDVKFSAYAKYIINGIYNILDTEPSLNNSEDYNKSITLQGLETIGDITPYIGGLTGEPTKLEIAQNLRNLVERECNYMNTFLEFLEKIVFNIKYSLLPDLSISPTLISSTKNSNTKTLLLTAKSSTAWTITSSSNWLNVGKLENSLLVRSGTGDATIELRISANNTYNTRSGYFKVSGGGSEVIVWVNQASNVYVEDSNISVDTNSITSSFNGGTFLVEITCNTSWTTSVFGDWFSLSPTSGIDDSVINVTVNSNSLTTTRSGYFVIAAEGTNDITVTINQGAASGSGGNSGSGGSTSVDDISYYYHPNILYSNNISSPVTLDIILTGSSSTLSGSKLYSVGILTDTHLSLENDKNTDSGDDILDEDDLIKVLKIFDGDSNIKFIASCGDITECWPYDNNTPTTFTDKTFPLKDDSRVFRTVYKQNTSRLRFFSPLGNHDYLGVFLAMVNGKNVGSSVSSLVRYDSSADTINTSGDNEAGTAYNSGVSSRIIDLWVGNVQLNEIISGGWEFDHISDTGTGGQTDMNFLEYNAYRGIYEDLSDPLLYVNANWETVKGNLSGWRHSKSIGTRTAYSKLSYWMLKDNDIFIFLSMDYGKDTTSQDGHYDKTRMLRAREILDVSLTAQNNNPYIKMLVEYVGTSYGTYTTWYKKINGSSSTSDEKYNYRIYSPNALVWLKEIIENNPTKKIYVFTHHFMPNRVGNTIAGLLPVNNSSYYSYQKIYYSDSISSTSGLHRGADAICGIEFWFITKLMNEHSNVIWFSGHSHISWTLGASSHITNKDYAPFIPTTPSDDYIKTVYTRKSDTAIHNNGGYFVALPSLAKPRNVVNGTGLLEKTWAEYTIMDIYSNGVRLKGYSLDAVSLGTGTWSKGGSNSGGSSGGASSGTDTELSSGLIKIIITNKMSNLETALFAGCLKFKLQESSSESDFCFRKERSYPGSNRENGGYVVYDKDKNPVLDGHAHGVNTERLLYNLSLTLIYTNRWEAHSSKQITNNGPVSALFGKHFTQNNDDSFVIKLIAGLDRSIDTNTVRRIDTATAYYILKFTNLSGDLLSGNPVIQDKGVYYLSITGHGKLYNSAWTFTPYETPSLSLDVMSESDVKVIYNQ